MNNKKMIVMPALSKLERENGIIRRKMSAGVFITKRNDNPNAFLLESALLQFRHLDIIGWFTNEVGYQRGSHRLKKLYDLCSKGEVDLVICYSKEDIEGCEIDSGNAKKSIMKCGTAFYCIKECVLIKADEVISLS